MGKPLPPLRQRPGGTAAGQPPVRVGTGAAAVLKTARQVWGVCVPVGGGEITAGISETELAFLFQASPRQSVTVKTDHRAD